MSEGPIPQQSATTPRDPSARRDFAAEIAESMDIFVITVREIAAGQRPESAVPLLLLGVPQLLLAGGRLGAIADVVPEGRFEPDTGADPDVEGVRTSLANLLADIDAYVEVFDPYSATPELLPNRLSDDLANIMSDLVHGLTHFRSGYPTEALWWWQFSYLSNWGGTASAALRALQSVVSHVRLEPAVDDQILVEDQLLAETAAQAVERPG